MSWISLMENIIQEDQQKIMGAVGSEAVQMYLQKYKVAKKFFKTFEIIKHIIIHLVLHTQDTKSLFFFIYSSQQGFRIDLSCKQLTVDFVNQSVLQISSQDVEGKRSDKTDFAERLGAMNRRWQILQGLVTEKVRHKCRKFSHCTGKHGISSFV